MIRRIARNTCCILAALTLTLAMACGNIQMFTSHHSHEYGNDDNKRRIAELESRVNHLEHPAATPTPTPTPDPGMPISQ